MTYSALDNMFKPYWAPKRKTQRLADREQEGREEISTVGTMAPGEARTFDRNQHNSQGQLLSKFGLVLRYNFEDYKLRKMLSGALAHNPKDMKALIEKILKNQLKPNEMNAILLQLVQACNGKNPAAERIILAVVHRASSQVLGPFLKSIKSLCNSLGNTYTYNMIYDVNLRSENKKKPQHIIEHSLELSNDAVYQSPSPR